MLPKELIYLIHEFVCVRRLIDWTNGDYHNTAHNLTMVYLKLAFRNPALHDPSNFLRTLNNSNHYDIMDRLQHKTPRSDTEISQWCMMMLKGPLEYNKSLAVWVYMQEATWFKQNGFDKESHICAEWITQRYHRVEKCLQGW